MEACHTMNLNKPREDHAAEPRSCASRAFVTITDRGALQQALDEAKRSKSPLEFKRYFKQRHQKKSVNHCLILCVTFW